MLKVFMRMLIDVLPTDVGLIVASKLSKVANGTQGDGDSFSDVAHSDGCVLHVHIRLAALRRLQVGAGRQVLRAVHGRCIIQLSATGEPLDLPSITVTHNSLLLICYRRRDINPPDRGPPPAMKVVTLIKML